MAQEKNLYLLLNNEGTPLARVRPQGPASVAGDLWQLEVLDDKIGVVLEFERFKLMAMTDASPSYAGSLVRSRNDIIQLKVSKLERDADDMRKNLRVLVGFKSLIYPITGQWTGRRKIEAHDLSCGGVAFFTDHSLQVGEQLEMVIPVTSQPLVVRCQVLRMRRTEQGAIPLMYAAKFVDLCNDEETLLREAVFSLQLSGRPRRAGR